jgi:hypothetical protein
MINQVFYSEISLFFFLKPNVVYCSGCAGWLGEHGQTQDDDRREQEGEAPVPRVQDQGQQVSLPFF